MKFYHDLIKEAKNQPKVSFQLEQPANTIVLNAGGEDMLKVASDGFYVRGAKVPADDKEAETVYNAFKQWLEWTMLNKEY